MNKPVSKLHLAIIAEMNPEHIQRQTLWYGGDPKNLTLMIIDVMKDWYEPRKKTLDKSIRKYHEMLEKGEGITFEKLAATRVKGSGYEIQVQIVNNIEIIYQFLLGQICEIYAREGEKLEDFASFDAFKRHMKKNYELDDAFAEVIDKPNEVTISRALVALDFKFGYTQRHTEKVEE